MRSSSSILTRLFTVALTGLLLLAGPARAQEGVPPKLALQVMLKVITYDRSFAKRGTGEFVIVILHEPSQASEAAQLEGVLADFKDGAIVGRKLRFAQVEVGPRASVRELLSQQSASAVLLLPTSGKALLASTLAAAASLGLYTLGLDPSQVESSATVGVANHDGRPQIVMNLELARQIGADFEPTVLRLARVVQRAE